jgi:hypothetical protein
MHEPEEPKRRQESILDENKKDMWVERLRWLGIKVEKQAES